MEFGRDAQKQVRLPPARIAWETLTSLEPHAHEESQTSVRSHNQSVDKTQTNKFAVMSALKGHPVCDSTHSLTLHCRKEETDSEEEKEEGKKRESPIPPPRLNDDSFQEQQGTVKFGD